MVCELFRGYSSRTTRGCQYVFVRVHPDLSNILANWNCQCMQCIFPASTSCCYVPFLAYRFVLVRLKKIVGFSGNSIYFHRIEHAIIDVCVIVPEGCSYWVQCVPANHPTATVEDIPQFLLLFRIDAGLFRTNYFHYYHKLLLYRLHFPRKVPDSLQPSI